MNGRHMPKGQFALFSPASLQIDLQAPDLHVFLGLDFFQEGNLLHVLGDDGVELLLKLLCFLDLHLEPGVFF